MASLAPTEEFTSTRLAILVADLMGFTRACRSRSDAAMARFLDDFYGLTEEVVSAAGGQVIKFMGDAVLAVFSADRVVQAVAAAVTLDVQATKLAAEHGLDFTLGANIHLGPAILAELGRGPSRRKDVIGRAVNQTFLLGRGSGIRVSEPAYRQLPSADRSPWEKHKPPAVYVLGEGGEPYAGLRQMAADNAVRW